MPDISVKDQIKKIVELQAIDREIFRLNGELKEKPAVLDQLREKFDERKKTLTDLEEKLKGVQVSRKEKELELKSHEDQISKANTQLSQMKTNKEYSAKMTEIEHIKADQSRIEEKVLILFEEGDLVLAEINKEKKDLVEEEKGYLAKKKEAEDDMKVIEDQIKVLQSKRSQAVYGIDSDYLRRYDRILHNKAGLAIVPIQNNACGGCFMNVTTQLLNEVKMKEQMVTCEMCSRILYLEDGL